MESDSFPVSSNPAAASCLLGSGFRGLIATLSLLLALTTVYTQFRAHGTRFLHTSQLQCHRKVLDHTAGSPARYRILSEWAVTGLLKSGNCLGISSSIGPFFLFRVGQNLIILLLAAAWYRRLRLSRPQTILGLILLAWGMSYAFRDSDLEFSLYSSLIFYLTAALLIVRGRDWWIPPLTLLAALNRETAILIPWAFLVCRIKWKSGRPSLNSRSLLIFILSSGLYLGAFFGLRSLFGWRELSRSWGHRAGFDMVIFNLTHPLTWAKLIWMVNILPLLCFFTFRSWPAPLKRLGLLIVPIWIVAHLLYLWISEVRMILIPLALVFIPGALMILTPQVEQILKRTGRWRPALYFGIIILSLTLTSVYTQYWVLGGRYLRESQLERHLDVLNNRASNPWQYRVLSEGVAGVFLKAAGRIGISSPVAPFLFFRVIQNIAIFLLAAAFYRRLKISREGVVLGLVLASWGMSYAFYNSDLHFSTYFDIIFYLIALLLIFSDRDWWIPPLTLLAALNRETAVLLPLALPAARLQVEDGKLRLPRRALIIFAVSIGLYFAVFFGLRIGLGWRSLTAAWGQPGATRLWINMKKGLAWQYFFLTVNILPLICIFTCKIWPKSLKRSFLAIVPLWLILHYYIKACPEETRFLLLPLIIGFVPGTLMLFRLREPSRGQVTRE